MLETNGSSRAQGRGVKIILRAPNGLTITQAIKLDFIVSKNEVKYKEVILGLKVAKNLSITIIDLRCDSQLVALQLQGEYDAKHERMEKYLRLAKPLLVGFKSIEVTHFPRLEN